MSSFQANVSLGFLLALILLGGPVVAQAQRPGEVLEEVPVSPTKGLRTFGPTASTSHTLQAFAFTGNQAADSTRFAASVFSRFCTAPCAFDAALFLPAGALVTSIELEGCDTTAAARVVTTLWRAAPALVALASVDTGTIPTPGCAFFSVNLATPETIDNENNTYVVEVIISGTTSATQFQAVRIYYNLQVSPAPAIATFSDVPTSHPFFKWIEALAAAGITTGCNASPPMYCPDNLVTRGQMAVFISKALGLQFAP